MKLWKLSEEGLPSPVGNWYRNTTSHSGGEHDSNYASFIKVRSESGR